MCSSCTTRALAKAANRSRAPTRNARSFFASMAALAAAPCGCTSAVSARRKSRSRPMASRPRCWGKFPTTRTASSMSPTSCSLTPSAPARAVRRRARRASSSGAWTKTSRRAAISSGSSPRARGAGCRRNSSAAKATVASAARASANICRTSTACISTASSS